MVHLHPFESSYYNAVVGGNYRGVLNDENCLNNFCVLRDYTTPQVYFGFSYNNFEYPGKTGTLTATYYFSQVTGNYVILPPNMLIYKLSVPNNQQLPTLIGMLRNIITTIYNLLFLQQVASGEVKIPEGVQELYISKTNGKTIYGIIDTGNFTDSKKRMVIEYTGYGDSLKNATLNTGLFTGGSNTLIVYSDEGIAATRYWTDFTSRLRPEQTS
jgi:hypothetical protein